MIKLFPNEQVIETEHFDVGQDWEVAIVGFFIIAAKDLKKRSFSDFSPEELNEFIQLLKKVRIAMKEVLGINNVYVWQNEDTEFSFHVWLFPRHEWMEPFGRGVASAKPIMLDAIEKRSKEPYLSEVRDAVKRTRDSLAT